jgi:4-amino-4-deoxy-L-arabinose transferase-like glycosyltransferase
MLTETLFIFLLTLLVLLCLRLSKSRRRSLAVGAGLVLGYAALVRPNILLLIPFLVLHFLFFVEGTIQKRIMLAIVPPVVCALVMLPWIVRNYLIQGEFVPVATLMGGVSLLDAIPPSDEMIEAAEYHGLKQFADDKDWEYLERSAYVLPNGYDLVPELFGQASPDQLPPDFDETEQSRLGYRRFFEYVRQDPVRYGKLVLTKLSLTFSIIPKQYSAEIGEDYGFGRFNVAAKLYSIVFLTVTFVLGSLGVIVTFRKRGPTILFDSVLLYHIVMQLIFRPASRYFLPGLVIASLFTASGLEALRGLRLLLSREHPRTVIRLRIWGASVLLFVLNTFYQVILQWEKIMQYWDHLVTRLI